MTPTVQRDTQLELPMGRLLQAGVILSTAIMIVGGVIYLIRHGAEQPNYKQFHGVEPAFRELPQIFHSIATGRGRGIIQLGVLCMIATPVMRVAFAIYVFLRERDWLYAGVSAIVLALPAEASLAACSRARRTPPPGRLR